jgi:hypothetical protein
MKRCPQCEFIYEDDQSLCDMDGVLLVFDSRILPNVHALTLPAKTSRTKRKKRTVPAFATLILALVLGMVYYVSTQLNTAQNTSITESSIPAVNLPPAIQPPAPGEPASALEVQTASKVEPKLAAAKPSTPLTTLAPVKKSPAKTVQAKPAIEEKKKDESKVGSILKKTGRILKKPFKF